MDDNGFLRTVYDCFEHIWIDGFGIKFICRYDETYRTDNNAKVFLSSLRQVLSADNQISTSVSKTCDIMDTTETTYCAERLRQKKPNRHNQRSFNAIKAPFIAGTPTKNWQNSTRGLF